MSSCESKEGADLDVQYTFKAAIDVKEGIQDFDTVHFESFDNLNLGFFEGEIWIRLDIQNKNVPKSYIIINNDLLNRNYAFFKLDSTDNTLKPIGNVADPSVGDHRTYNFANPNFKIDLEAHERATYIVALSSDGRTVDATPALISTADYFRLVNENTTWSVVFFGVLAFLLLINLYQWSIHKQGIYLYYILYMLSTFLMYLGFEGQLYNHGLKKITVEHIIFLSVRFWVLSLILYTSKFLEIEAVAPRYYRFMKWLLAFGLGGITMYQMAFYDTSISHLHYFENLLSFLWLVLILGTILLSAKSRRLELKYYLIPFSCFLLFITLGLIDGHFKILPGTPFVYIKLGTLVEFSGFTYFMSILIRRKLRRAASLENELAQNKKELANLTKLLEEKFANVPLDSASEVTETSTIEETEESKDKIALLAEEMADIEKIILRELDERKHYANSDLSLSKLAELVNIPAYKLSMVLNQKMDTTFYDLINSKRVEASLSLLRDNKNLTIEAITAEVGFKSKSTFYRAFKKYKGTTPTDFLLQS